MLSCELKNLIYQRTNIVLAVAFVILLANSPLILKPIVIPLLGMRSNATLTRLSKVNRLYVRDFDQLMAQSTCREDSSSCLDQLNKLDEAVTAIKRSIPTYDKCFECIDGVNNRHIVHFHTLWQILRPDAALERLMKLNIMSFLATQNLCCTRLVLWTLLEFPLPVENELRKTFASYIADGVFEITHVRREHTLRHFLDVPSQVDMQGEARRDGQTAERCQSESSTTIDRPRPLCHS